MVARRLSLNGMGTATGSFTDDGGAFLRLQIEGELFAAREGLLRGEDVHGLIGEARSGNPGESPVLMRLVLVPVGEVVDVGRLPEQIGDHEINHRRVPAMVLPQVKDQGIGVGDKIHCSDYSRRADIRRRKGAELDVADVVTEDFYLREGTVLLLHHGAELCLVGGAWLVRPGGSIGLLG